MANLSVEYLERCNLERITTLEIAVRNEAYMFNREGSRKIKNPWRTALLMFNTVPEDFSNREKLKLLLDRWYTRLHFQAPELWNCEGNVWDNLLKIFEKYCAWDQNTEWYQQAMILYETTDNAILYT